MSMICELFAVPARAARRVLDDPAGIHALLESMENTDAVLSLEKSWHGLHFVLTGTAWEGEPPLNFLTSGGPPVGNVDVGYGPARVIEPEEVARLHVALAAISDQDFEQRFDPTALAQADIYPQIWDEPREELVEEYGSYFQETKRFVQDVAQSGRALLVTIR